jgi:signal transduction histidine kinase
MRSRAAEIGGRITITSAPGSGTLVRVCVQEETDGT